MCGVPLPLPGQHSVGARPTSKTLLLSVDRVLYDYGRTVDNLNVTLALCVEANASIDSTNCAILRT